MTENNSKLSTPNSKLLGWADSYIDAIDQMDTLSYNGKVTEVAGLVIKSLGPKAAVGEVCDVINSDNQSSIKAEVVGFKDDYTLLMPLGFMHGILPGARVVSNNRPLSVPVGDELLGRVLDGLGNPIDDKGSLLTMEYRPVFSSPPHPLRRTRIKKPIVTGIRAIDGCLSCGEGQRIGIFSGSGIGKSILLGMIARYCSADVNVIGLIGERGREVRDFLEKDLKEGIGKSVIVIATSDQPALVRVKASLFATTIAEYFRDKGLHVMLLMDSITRIAVAQRELGLTIGEPPTTKGYTPSVFAFLPRLLERTGTSEAGSITGFYTVLVEQGDMDEPIADSVRAILDGHIVLSRKLADKNHYPAIDVLSSSSRLMLDVVSPEHLKGAKEIINILATYQDSEDLINIGAYVKGSNNKIDYAINHIDSINDFLTQNIDDKALWNDTISTILSFADKKTTQPIPATNEQKKLTTDNQ